MYNVKRRRKMKVSTVFKKLLRQILRQNSPPTYISYASCDNCGWNDVADNTVINFDETTITDNDKKVNYSASRSGTVICPKCKETVSITVKEKL